ncbi:hypothetical protein G7Y89_g13805 [Cudoniella acicularis]|uniref:AAA+ ATPase domain-containing protein n=1 Tax=Cudoniella acicularis TaxID=354080 RepID=A0A8H4R7J3_9HELO|nr:hypothetical protein G7Y89_g13805 [Cudoniella acicularis]
MDAKLATLEEKLAKLELTYEELSQKIPTAEVTSEKHEKLASVNGDQNEEEAAPTIPNSRARILHNVADEKTDERRDEYPDGTIPGSKELENTKPYAFTFRKFFNYRHSEDEIVIHDTKLRDLLRSQLRHYRGHMLLGDTINLESPFEPIILNWDKLEKTGNAEGPSSVSDQTRSDLRLLLKTVSENSTDRRLEQLLKTRGLNMDQKRITYETLWTIFPPGEIVFGKPFQKQPQLFIVQDNVRPWPEPETPRGRSAPWVLKCWMYDWTGHVFLRTLLKLRFERFEGAKPINSLPYYPFRYHENRKDMEDELLERGKTYRRVCIAKKGEQMYHYKGGVIFSRRGITDTPDEGSQDDDDGQSLSSSFRRNRLPVASKTSQIDSTVMVDFVSYNRYGPAVAAVGSLVPLDDDPDCNCSECRQNDELSKMSRKDFDKFTAENRESNWSPEQFMLCPPRVLGYVLRDKQWAQLQINVVNKNSDDNKPPKWYLDKLKLSGPDSGEETKTLLMNLVRNHGGSGGSEGKNEVQMDDIIANKGKGLVILLYGPPGVGKTSTAETVAIAAQKPLFPVSVADVGTKAKYVEANLEKIFDLATTWEAILLIDEADVFLESRSRGAGNNTERNALVSGILFLTTNQIAQFDVAVQSRIHIALKYEPLSEIQTSEIFMQFLNQLNEKKQVKNLRSIESWVQSDIIRRKAGFDGRQIRNIISCAMNLARAEYRQLEKDDLLKVVDIVRDFKTEFKMQFDRYMRSQGGSE